ncbi:GtrA family protein [Stenotrophomonas sp. SAM-B]|nr:GtrA family protein [Stenotrophomonas sp. SAM-B]
MSGGFNTAVTYAAYLFLLQVAEYKLAYTISYLGGLVIAFTLNRLFVFRAHRGWKSIVLFPLVYAAQYLLGLAVAIVWVETLSLPPAVAPIAAIIITVPVTFILSRAVFGRPPASS